MQDDLQVEFFGHNTNNLCWVQKKQKKQQMNHDHGWE